MYFSKDNYSWIVVLILFNHYVCGMFNPSTINHISDIICQTKTQSIRVLTSQSDDDVDESLNHLLLYLNGPKCSSAPIIVEDENNVYYRSYNHGGLGPSVLVVVLPHFSIRRHQIVHKYSERKEFIKYFVIVTELISLFQVNTFNSTRNIFQQFWDQDILNVVIVLNIGQLMKLYTYMPFTTSGNIELVDITHRQRENLFYDKLNNIDGFRLKVAMHSDEVRAIPYNCSDGQVRYYGVDGFIANVVRER